MEKEMSVGSREDVLRVKELMLTVSRELGIEGTYMASIILDILHERGYITKAEGEEYR